jgi:RHS repeat-associated protein
LYVYTYDGRLVREYSDGVVQRDYLYAGGNRIGVSEKVGGSYKLRYFLTDHLGSTRATIDSTGLVLTRLDYYPYGTLRAGSYVSYNTKIRYTGKMFDDEDVNETYFGARYLDNEMQRFSAVDPLQAKYPGWSPYVYTRDNPIRLYDPNGTGSENSEAQRSPEAMNTNLGWQQHQAQKYLVDKATDPETYRRALYTSGDQLQLYGSAAGGALWASSALGILEPQAAPAFATLGTMAVVSEVVGLVAKILATDDQEERKQLRNELLVVLSASGIRRALSGVRWPEFMRWKTEGDLRLLEESIQKALDDSQDGPKKQAPPPQQQQSGQTKPLDDKQKKAEQDRKVMQDLQQQWESDFSPSRP